MFPHYCRRGKVSNQRMSHTRTPFCSLARSGWQYDNVTHLNRKCWRQFAKECGLSAGSKDGGVVDVMFSTGVRHYNQDRFQASTNRCSAIAPQPKFKSHSHPHHTSPNLTSQRQVICWLECCKRRIFLAKGTAAGQSCAWAGLDKADLLRLLGRAWAPGSAQVRFLRQPSTKTPQPTKNAAAMLTCTTATPMGNAGTKSATWKTARTLWTWS